MAITSPSIVQENQSPSEARCVACFAPTAFFGARRGYRYHRCTQCSTLQITPQPQKEDLDRAYAELYSSSNHISADTDAFAQATKGYFQAILQVIQAHCPSGRVTEIGAGWGALANLLSGAGYGYEGVELSQDMFDYCVDSGINVVRGGIDELSGKDRDVLVMTNVFEHLVGHDQWLDKLNGLLPSGAYFISAQPTAHFPLLFATLFRMGIKALPLPQLHVILAPPWHTVLFTLQGMQTILERHGFELVTIQAAPQNREKGLTEVLQRTLEAINAAGWKIAGRRWPLIINHIFVFRKK